MEFGLFSKINGEKSKINVISLKLFLSLSLPNKNITDDIGVVYGIEGF